MASASVTAPSCSTIDSDELGGTFCINGATTDANGRFQFTSLPGDVALLVSGDLGAYVNALVTGDTDADHPGSTAAEPESAASPTATAMACRGTSCA